MGARALSLFVVIVISMFIDNSIVDIIITIIIDAIIIIIIITLIRVLYRDRQQREAADAGPEAAPSGRVGAAALAPALPGLGNFADQDFDFLRHDLCLMICGELRRRRISAKAARTKHQSPVSRNSPARPSQLRDSCGSFVDNCGDCHLCQAK